ncbi:MAG: holin family protein [Rhodobacteraceae bacterium]|nr:holin family protein [Paracoccaceae bacterium]
MGVIGKILGALEATTAIGQAATTVAEVFTPNATKKMEAAHEAYLKSLEEFGAEYQFAREGWFDRLVNGLNRLPRPFLAFGTLGLFVHAMADPEGFTRRMVGLNYVPEPLWWLLAAIVGFYFGARESFYLRNRPRMSPAPAATAAGPEEDENAALAEWRKRDGA